MSQLDFFEDLGVEPDIQLLFRHIDIEGKDILFAAAKFAGEESQLQYICWDDSERYKKASAEEIYKIEHNAYWKIHEILEKGFDILEKACKEK